MTPVEFDGAWAEEVEQGLDDYLVMLADYAMGGLDADDEAAFETESGLPYCGCSTCEVREILAFVIPRVLQGQREGLVSLVSE